MKIPGKVAIVTGGCNGIGKGIVYGLLRRAAKVAILDIDDKSGADLLAKVEHEFGKGQAVYKHCDVSQQKQLEDTFASVKSKFGGLNIIVNNAGIANNDLWEKEIEINLVAMIRGTKLGVELMDKNTGNDGGVVLNISSMAGVFPLTVAPTYTATKAGIIGFTRAMRPAAKMHGVRVNSICPSFVPDTKINDELLETQFVKTMMPDGVPEDNIITMDSVVDAVINTIEDDSLVGKAVVVTKRYGSYVHEFTLAKL